MTAEDEEEGCSHRNLTFIPLFQVRDATRVYLPESIERTGYLSSNRAS